MLRKDEAIRVADQKAERTGKEYSVLERTDHPSFPGETVYLIARSHEIHTLSPGSTIVHVTTATRLV